MNRISCCEWFVMDFHLVSMFKAVSQPNFLGMQLYETEIMHLNLKSVVLRQILQNVYFNFFGHLIPWKCYRLIVISLIDSRCDFHLCNAYGFLSRKGNLYITLSNWLYGCYIRVNVSEFVIITYMSIKNKAPFTRYQIVT